MIRDVERQQRIRAALRSSGFETLACALPANVLLTTGYWPVVGRSIAIVSASGTTILLVPDDERHLAERGWANEVYTFDPGPLNNLRSPDELIRILLRNVGARHDLGRGRFGYESGSCFEPATYASMHLYGDSLRRLLEESFTAATLVPANGLLARLRETKTTLEVDRIRLACRVAQIAFERGAAKLRPGMLEAEAAQLFQAQLTVQGLQLPDVGRAGGSVFCMSGHNSALAGAAYARTRNRQIEATDLVLIHCNSYVDGLWTDISRTYNFQRLDGRMEEMYAAVLEARRAALDTIRPGVRGSEVDYAARSVLTARGFGEGFTHPTGHGVGFAAITSEALPRLHPQADDMLTAGMVFNVEPAIYIKGYGGIRHCDVVAVRDEGAEVLTPFHSAMDQLAVYPASGALLREPALW